jgi:hypothetical protein
MKLAEEWTSPRFKEAMLRHPSPGDLKLPAQPRGRMSRMQFFNSGGGRSCQHALVLLISTMQAMIVQRRKFVLVNTDVKGAFPSVPTDFMGQRYNSIGVTSEERLFNFLQTIDTCSNIRVRVRHGFSRAEKKGKVGIHQGGVLSPPKYSWSLDPLLLYLEKVGEKHGLGIDLGKVRNERGEWEDFTGTYAVDTPNGKVIFYYQGGRLVALAFADDVCMLAESVPQAQQLLDAAQEYYVAASATLCAPKSTFTGNFELQPWSIEIVLPCTDESAVEQVDELEMEEQFHCLRAFLGRGSSQHSDCGWCVWWSACLWEATATVSILACLKTYTRFAMTSFRLTQHLHSDSKRC